MRLRRFSVDLSSPLRTARAETTEREGFLVGVRLGEGDAVADRDAHTPGIGEATPLPGWTEPLAACEAALERAAERGWNRASVSDRSGDPIRSVGIDPDEAPAARHGLMLALDDAAARDADRSLAERLADRAGFPEPSDSVPVNATIGDGTAEAAARDANRAVDDGYRCVKLKLGARSLDVDVERARAVRRAVGPAVELRVDANGAWDRETARRALEQLAPLDVAYAEQPLPAGDLDGLARLRAETDVPVALDETLANRSVGAAIAADAADVLVLKPMALGGPDRAVDAAKRAREAGVEPVITTTIDAAVARTAAVHVAGAVPDVAACGLATGGLLDDDLAPDPCPVSDGRLGVPDGPGLAGDAFDGLI